jgi:hypothetical protein
MAYFKDLSPYENSWNSDKLAVSVLHVGWLEDKEFEKGETSQEFKDKLFQFCLDQNLIAIMRGFQECIFCGLSWSEWGKKHPDYGPDAHWMSLGDGEIRVIGKSVIYGAPALIYHYVVEHKYKPPQEFIDAVLTGPQPGQDEHKKHLDLHKIRR